MAGITESHLERLNIDVIEPIQRYHSTVLALRAGITSQRNKRANHMAANSAIARDSVQNPNHEDLVAKASKCLNDYVDASNRLGDDYERYHMERNEEIITLLNAFANHQIKYCEDTLVVWTELEASIAEDLNLTLKAKRLKLPAGTDQPLKVDKHNPWLQSLPNSLCSSSLNTSSKPATQGPPTSSLLDLQEGEMEDDDSCESV